MRVLGIDLGRKRIGVAVSDRSGTIASPLTVMARGRSQREDHTAIAALVREEEATMVVVGLPLNMDGTEGASARSARLEVERMATVVGVPVVLHDERRTTVQADRVLMERHVGARERRSEVDKVAAAFILQSWLDGRRASDGG